MKKPVFATFWQGRDLSPYDLACLASFKKHGHEVVVYYYERPENLPEWVIPGNAREILAPDFMGSFIVEGKASLAHFSDYFRYMMCLNTEYVWVDMDILLLREFDLDSSRNIMGLEEPGSICTAVLRLDPSDKRSHEVIGRVKQMVGHRLKWGATGPALLTEVYEKDDAYPINAFYPVHYDDYWKVFLPEYLEECRTRCEGSYTLHLWNHLVAEMGVYNRVGPPVGSYLHQQFEQLGANALFTEFYPASIMKHLVTNAVERPGRHAGVGRIAVLLGPALKRSINKRIGLVRKALARRAQKRAPLQSLSGL
jgi:hypothetical protein